MPGEWHGGGGPVMPVRHDVHRTRCAALLTDEAPADRRPGQVLRQGVQSDINHTSIALAGRTLDVAGHVPSASHSAGPPRGYLRVHRDGGRCKAMADDFVADGVAQIIDPLWIGTAAGYRSSQVREAQRKLGAVQVRRRSLPPSPLPPMVAGARYESHTGGAW